MLMVSLTRPILWCFLLICLHLNQAVAQSDAKEPGGAPGEQSSPAQATETDSARRVRRLGDASGDEVELDLRMPGAPGEKSSDSAEYDLPDQAQNDQLQSLLSRLAARPGNAAALAELDDLLSEVLIEANRNTQALRFDEAARLLGVVRNVNPGKQGLDAAYRRFDQLRNIEGWLASARVAQQNGALIEPAGANALFYYRKVLNSDSGQPDALKGLLEIQQTFVDYAIDAARNLDFELADDWLAEASGVREPQDLVTEARITVTQYHSQQAETIEQDVITAIEAGNFDYAEFTMIDLIALGGNEDRVAALRERLEREKVYGQYRPGQVVQDRIAGSGTLAPAVVVVAAGSFLMGSPLDERGRTDNEGPQHRVTIGRGFGLGVQEVTVSQFRDFIEATGYHTDARRVGKSVVWDDASGRLTERERVNWRHDFDGNPAAGNLPVLHVTWNDAQGYLRWLSEATGERYRLPTEAEFEYALRAGSITQYWWGDSRPRERVENLTGERDQSASERNWSTNFRGYGDGYWGPAPGMSFMSNPWGLYDMAGNASEWVMDCWHDTYVRAPVDGSAWENPGCKRRVVRGGYWASSPDYARSAARLSAANGFHGPSASFRVARDL